MSHRHNQNKETNLKTFYYPFLVKRIVKEGQRNKDHKCQQCNSNKYLEDAIFKLQMHKNIHLIPATDKLLEYEVMINTEPGREYLLKECLEKVKDLYDYIIIDCPPSLGIFSINSLVTANYFIVPMQTENFAFIGLDKILQVADKVRKRLNPNLELAGIVLIRYTSRIKFSQAVVSNIESNSLIGKKIFHTKVRQDINLMESSAFSQSIFEYAPKSRGADDFIHLAKEIRKLYDEK